MINNVQKFCENVDSTTKTTSMKYPYINNFLLPRVSARKPQRNALLTVPEII